MPAEGVPWIPGDALLTSDELVRAAQVAVGLGVTEVRLTGGEPLLRPDVVDIVARLSQTRTPGGLLKVSLTTNGLRLPGLAASLKDAGLERVNISLDTLRRSRFLEMTRRDKLAETLAGVEAARAVGLTPIKLNAVIMRDVNDDEIVDLFEFAIERDLHLRFIEHMPLDAGHTWRREAMVTGEEILGVLKSVASLVPVGDRGSSPAQEYRVGGSQSTIGVIASVTTPFCGQCDRVRLTADGQFRNCLFARDESDLRGLMRRGASDEAIADAMRSCVRGKRLGHQVNSPDFVQPARPMSAIGG